jgi:hypothetical protein
MMNMMMSCLRCGHGWESRVEGRPKNCPGCKSPAWDRPKVSNRVATHAHGLVAAAIQSGNLVREPCEVCGNNAEAHHEDYSKPLDVTWLCKKHHAARHAEIGDALMEGGLNLREVPDELVRGLKSEAALRNSGLRDFCVGLLRDGLKRSQAEVVDEQKVDAVRVQPGDSGVGEAGGRLLDSRDRASRAGRGNGKGDSEPAKAGVGESERNGQAVGAGEVFGAQTRESAGHDASGSPGPEVIRAKLGGSVCEVGQPDGTSLSSSSGDRDGSDICVPKTSAAVDLRSDEDEGQRTVMPESQRHFFGGTEMRMPFQYGGQKPAKVIEGGRAKPSEALKAIAAGNFTRVPQVEEESAGDAGAPAPTCANPECGKPLVEGRGKMAGKWACADEACGMYGKEQKGRR